eukprot:s597_g6.t1
MAMKDNEVLKTLASLLRGGSVTAPVMSIDVCCAGMTDLCAPELDQRFNARLPVRAPAQLIQGATSQQSVCIFYLHQLLRANPMWAHEDHALDGACLVNQCSYETTFDALHDVCLGLLTTVCIWLRHLLDSKTSAKQLQIFVVCHAGKHCGLFCGRVLGIMLEVVLRCSAWNVRVSTTWGGQTRCEREKIIFNSFGTAEANQEAVSGCRQSTIVSKHCSDYLPTYMWDKNVSLLTVTVDDLLYESCRRKTMPGCTDGTLALGTADFLLARLLGGAKTNLKRSVLEILSPKSCVGFIEAMASNKSLSDWSFLMHAYVMKLWPHACSLCCSQLNARYALLHRVQDWFSIFWSSAMKPSLEPSRAAAEPKGLSRRKAWADLNDDDEQDSYAAANAMWQQEGSAPVRAASTLSAAQDSARSSTETSHRSAPVRAASESPDQARRETTPVRAGLRKGNKRVSFAEDAAEIKFVPSVHKVWQLTVDCENRVITKYDMEFITDIREHDEIEVVLLDDVANAKEYVLAKGRESRAMHQVASTLFNDDQFLCELRLWQANAKKLCTMPVENLEGSSERNELSTIQYILFYHLYAIATLGTQDLGVHATSRFLYLVGTKFYEELKIDMLELLQKFVFYAWLAASGEVESSLLTVFVPQCEGGQEWWNHQQQHLACVARSAFAREYVCVITSPYLDDETSKQALRREFRLMKHQKDLDDIKALPDVPAFEYWYEHNAAVLADDALPSPRPLPPFRASAIGHDGTWGNADGRRGEVTRRNMIAESHVFLRVQCALPQVCLQTVLGENFVQLFCQEIEKSNLWAPAWLKETCDSAVHARVQADMSSNASDAFCQYVSEAILWFPQLIYQALGLALLQAMRPDTVLHPHLRAQFDLHLGVLLAMEIKSQRLDIYLRDFLRGCGIEFRGTDEENHWILQMVRNRKPASSTPHGLKVHSMWGEKLRAQYYADETVDAVYLVAEYCGEADQTKFPCRLHTELCGWGTLCNQYHALTKRHGLLLFFQALRYLNCTSLGDRGISHSKDDNFTVTLAEETGFRDSDDPHNPHAMQLFHLPRFLPRDSAVRLFAAQMSSSAMAERLYGTRLTLEEQIFALNFLSPPTGIAMEPSGLPRDTLLRILRMTAWRPDWGRASGVSKAWHTVISNDVCYKAVRQRWIEDHDEDLQCTLRLIAAEDRRKREKLREGRPGSSDSE